MVCVIGEALIDLVLAAAAVDASGTDGYLAHPGGSPYNVAIGLARLGQHCRLLARLSSDAFGRQLRAHAEANRVDLSLAVSAGEPSTLAVVSLDAQRNASYDFYRTGTADWQWTAAELARIPDDAGWLHTGSLASWTEPGAAVIEARLAELAPGCLISFDPNIRPALMGDRDAAVARIERLVALADVVKVSAEDLAWLYPGDRAGDRAGRLAGPRAVAGGADRRWPGRPAADRRRRAGQRAGRAGAGRGHRRRGRRLHGRPDQRLAPGRGVATGPVRFDTGRCGGAGRGDRGRPGRRADLHPGRGEPADRRRTRGRPLGRGRFEVS